jgi:hypothetical protein
MKIWLERNSYFTPLPYNDDKHNMVIPVAAAAVVCSDSEPVGKA